MKKIFILTMITLLSACSTPRTTLQNYYGDTVTCGGDVSSSLALGGVGYYWQKQVDKECVENYQKYGYGIIGKEE